MEKEKCSFLSHTEILPHHVNAFVQPLSLSKAGAKLGVSRQTAKYLNDFFQENSEIIHK